MNIVRELRKKKGIQQKELAIIIGVSTPTVSDWETNKKDPSGERLRKLSEYFGVDELTILGKGVVDLTDQADTFQYDPDSPKSEAQQIKEYYYNKLIGKPQTDEARLLAQGVDKMPPEDRKRALGILSSVYAEYFSKVEDKIG